MKKTLISSFFIAISTSLYAQVGIGLTEPKAFLNVAEGKTVLFGADTVGVQAGTGKISPKMIWYASNGGFRAGGISDNFASNNNWDKANVGQYSFASGADTKASGYYSTAMGNRSMAIGISSTALGSATLAIGSYSTAMGGGTSAFGFYSTAMGRDTRALEAYSTAMGFNTEASGFISTALGSNTTASGSLSTAMGSAVKANHIGSFIIGDNSSSLGSYYSTTANNQMMMHFAGGYVFYTSNAGQENSPSGIELQPNANAWSVISDSTRKENFRTTDGLLFLKKISSMRLGSWNYKGQDIKQYRHYGPMAQDFFAAFGHDELGIVGEDKSINQADFDGVNLIAIQALIKEVEALKAENKNLKQAEMSMKAETQSMKEKMQQFERQLSTIMASGAISRVSK
ncbi:tail fiber domain-containing protein [Dyadobacter sp. CY356]|uniref:tail fiber domain-containing protein n=1 Tax=Dyadobacter sp. CY356 TaxID=2906442 RepID=UPI001F38F9F2|nr:tail fiber domain-containing protein [Dyadobacter sp. CY356]MCF0054487.1 tail fiber domain-containing protein [Dyadobacter sp. CY356]